LERSYNIRHSWCTALSNETFSAGFKTTSRSESTNSVLNGIGSRTCSLTKFVLEFERKIGEWRRNESDSDFACAQGKPALLVRSSIMLQQAAEFYTHTLYKMFEKEFRSILVASTQDEGIVDESMYSFKVTVETKWGHQASKVVLDTKKSTVHCSCKKFESMGILCTHSLVALKARNISKIPDVYLLKRWSKSARNRVGSVDQMKIFNMEGTDASIVFTNQAMKFAHDIVYRSASNEASRLKLWEQMQSMSLWLDDYKNNHALKDSQYQTKDKDALDSSLACEDGNGCDIPIQDPNRIRGKGRDKGERLKGHFEKRRRGSSLRGGHSHGLYIYSL
jgi:hypothetical protein